METKAELNATDECSTLPFFNRTAERDAVIYIFKDAERRGMLGVLFTILAVGIVGNLAFLFVIGRVPYMRTTTNVYLSSLAVADLMFLLFSIVQYNFYFNYPVRNHLSTASLAGCVGAFMPQYVTYFASVSTVTLVSLERYHSICKPLKVRIRQGARMKYSAKLVIGSWLVAVGLAGLAMLRYANLFRLCVAWPDKEPYRNLPVQLGFCVPVSRSGMIFGHALESVIFAVALIANATMYILIVIGLHRRVKQKRHLQLPDTPCSRQTQQALNIRNQVALMLIANGVMFFLCHIPSVGLSLAFLGENLAGVPEIVTYEQLVVAVTISHVFLFLQSAINPIIYNLTSHHYRQAFIEAFFCRPLTKKGRHVTNIVVESSTSAENR